MINELADKLIEAGYKGGFNFTDLLRACGDKFFSLVNFKHPDFTDANEPYPETFGANSEEKGIFYQGFSPEEALARLWLATHAST